MTARAPAHSFVVEGAGVEGTVDLDETSIRAIDVRFPLAALKAADTLGQHQLDRFLALDTQPVATAVLTAPLALEGTRGGHRRGRGRARISLAARPAVEIDLEVSGTEARASARMQIRFTQLGYTPPRLLFLKVDDLLQVEVELTLTT